MLGLCSHSTAYIGFWTRFSNWKSKISEILIDWSAFKQFIAFFFCSWEICAKYTLEAYFPHFNINLYLYVIEVSLIVSSMKMKKEHCKNERAIHEKQYVTHQSVSPCMTCVYKRLKCVNMVGNRWMLKFYELFSLLVCWLICKYNFFGVFAIIVFCMHLKLSACAFHKYLSRWH